MRVGSFRIITQDEDDAIYVRRIVDRKILGRSAKSCDARVRPSSISLQEFLMKYAQEQHDRPVIIDPQSESLPPEPPAAPRKESASTSLSAS